MGKNKNKNNNRVKPDAENETEDRFRAAETRPQFRSVKKHTSKVVLDERFASVLTDARFQLDGKDKYGRKKNEAVKDDLTAFYTVEEGEEKKEQRKPSDDDSASSGSEDSDDARPKKDEKEQDEDPASRIAYLKAFSRGEVDVSSSSDDDDSSQSSNDDEDEDGEDPVYGSAGVLDPSNREEEIEITYDPSPYLVVTNMDWDHIRAVDLFSILSSFTPPGAVKRVQVYQSDFGKEQIAKEKIYGPVDIWKKKMEKVDDEDDESGADENSSGADDSESEGDNDNDDQDSTNNDSEHEEEEKSRYLKVEPDALPEESDFDPEKLRAYETSKLKYYFAVVEFANTGSADAAYREVDGLEFENSSSAVDLRALPSEALDNVITDRLMRDAASSIPSNYVPPDFVVSALQQTNVQCTWDQGDAEREKALTKYSSGGWEGAEADDLKTYLASDGSSDEEDSGEEGGKGSTMRKLLGLDSDNENDDQANSEKSESSEDDGDSDDEHEGIQGMNKEVKFMPGKKNLEEKIRAKLETKNAAPEELTPWQKYQEKRKEKRRERKQASKKKKNGDESEDDSDEGGDDFFADESKPSQKKKEARGAKGKTDKGKTDEVFDQEKSRKELELLLAGEDEEEQARDYDIRGIQRMEKNKDKKLKGGRKRKEEKLASAVSGTDFKVNTEDNRFAAVLEGSDDRFGIDKTDPNYKDTSAMREILAEQTQRRKKKRRKTAPAEKIAPDISADAGGKSAGSAALSSLVSRLKSKVSKKTQ
jgi:hypothetical protein